MPKLHSVPTPADVRRAIEIERAWTDHAKAA